MNVLAQLVERIRAGGTLDTAALSSELGASPALLEAMLEHLQRLGLIQPYVHSSEACGECGLRGSCGARSDGGIRLWQGVAEQGSDEADVETSAGVVRRCDALSV